MERRKSRVSILPYLLIAPLAIWILLTVIVPVIDIIRDSFLNTTYVGTQGDFIGFKNYKSVLTDANYWQAWLKSLHWLIGCTVIQTILGFGTALLLNGKGRFRSIARVWTVIPWVIPTIVVSIMWQWIFNSSYGILNYVLRSLGLISQSVNFLGGSTAMWTLILINVWHWFPFTAIIILAGLSTIDGSLYESADVDGANGLQKFRYITFPSLSNVTFALGVVGTLWCFNIFDIIYITTEGGPLGLTTTAPVYIYREAFKNYNISRSSAASIVTALLLMVVTAILVLLTRPKNDT